MNLTTVRTHQYAVWITIGFFEIKKQGDIGMLGQGLPSWPSTSWARDRRLERQERPLPRLLPGRPAQAHRLQPRSVGSFRAAVVYRKVIQ